jgi:hypothetical protein
MNLTDVIVHLNVSLRSRTSYKRWRGLRAVLVAAAHKFPQRLLFFIVLITIFSNPLLVFMITILVVLCPTPCPIFQICDLHGD